MGVHVVWMVESIFPYLNLERKSKADRSLLSCPNGYKLEQKLLDIDECPDENPCRPDG
jgi:hypothetical protein